MKLKQLGTTGVSLSEIALGTSNFAATPDVLTYAIDNLGANFIDTAEIYGTEEAVGKALGKSKNKAFVATKVSGEHLRYDDLLKAADGSLARLGVKTIDLYQVHWPNQKVPLKETMKAMEELVDSGKVRFIGVSNFNVSQMEEAQASLKKHKVASNQVAYNLMDRRIEREVLPYCERNKITVLGHSALAGGELLRESAPGAEVLRKIANEMHKSTAQIALAWCLQNPNVIGIVKASSESHLREDCEAAGLKLTPEQMSKLNTAFPPRSKFQRLIAMLKGR